MMPFIKKYLLLLLITCGLAYNISAQGESNGLAIARQQVLEKQYESALGIYKQLYDAKPYDKSLYKEYLDVLVQLKMYDTAMSIVDKMQLIRRDDATILIDKGFVYKLSQGKPPKSNPYFEAAYNKVAADEYSTRQIADAFVKANEIDWAIRVYEKSGNNIYNNTAYFSKEVAILYAQLGQYDKAIKANIALASENPRQINDVKESLSRMIQNDAKIETVVYKEIDKILKDQPQNTGVVLLKVWLLTQKNNYQAALETVIDFDKSGDNAGNQILGFVKMAAEDGKTAVAIKGTEAILALGKSSFVYEKAMEENLQLRFKLLQENIQSAQLIEKLKQDFQIFLMDYPEYYGFNIIRDYAKLQALYVHEIDSALSILKAALQAPNISRELRAWCKMDMGDYLIIKNEIWEATLIYAQVEKEFQQDPLGEQARYKNAMLAYFNQDFDWAQEQLKTIKAATSELLANDAMYLSILITENTDPLDTSKLALKAFASADLLFFQNRLHAADSALNNIFIQFPSSTIIDDVYMKRAKIAMQLHQNDQAIHYLSKLINDNPEEVLADDALFTIATIYEKDNNIPAAIAAYEKLITKYNGSTFVQQARIKYNLLKNQQNPL